MAQVLVSKYADHLPLYRQAQIRGRSAEERRAVRQERSRPLLDELEPWLCAKLGMISQKT